MSNSVFTTVPNKMKITLTKEIFQPGDLIMITKITAVEYEGYMMKLRQKEENKIINSFPNEAMQE